MKARLQSWWSRPCGGRDVAQLAFPLVVSTASWTIMNFTDRMFLLWHRETEMAAAMPAGMTHFTMLCFPLGIALYVNTFVAQYHGSQQPERIGHAVWQGLRVGWLTMPLFLLAGLFAGQIFTTAGHEPLLGAYETIYFQVLALGAGATVLSAPLSAFFSGRGQTRVVMIVDSAASALNIALDYAWIFGNFGFPELGIEGAAWATVCSQWFKLAAYTLIMCGKEFREPYGLISGYCRDSDLWRRLWRHGGVSGFQMLIEIGAFTLFLLMMGGLGNEAMAATTLAFNVNGLAFVPLLGVGIAVSTIVGQQIGAERSDLAARGTWTALWMSMAYMGTLALLYVTVPDLFLLGHKAGADAESFEQLRNMTVILLRFVAAYALFDGLNIIFVSALKGAGDTPFILLSSMIISPLYLLLGWVGIEYWNFGLMWCWSIITAWICTLGVVYLGRFLQGDWKTMRVIETFLPDGGDHEAVEEPEVAVH